MELFDVVDKNRNFLGYTKVRGEILEDNEYNVGIECWIFNNKKVLMTQRSKNKSHPFKWEVPGGCSQSMESSTDTLIRELKEEIGVSGIKEEFELIGTELYKKQFVDIYKSNKIIDLNKIILQKEEVSDIRFISRSEFLKMVENKEIVESVYNRYLKIKDKLERDW